MNPKENLLASLDGLKNAIINDDIDYIVSALNDFGIDNKRYSILMQYLHGLLTNFIIDYIQINHLESLRIERKNVYHETTYDWYRVVNNELLRNGHNTNYEVTRLYQAYKYIKNNTNKD